MAWLIHVLDASIGKKTVMALTGAMLVLFVLTHLLGNSMVFQGRDALQAYAARLHSWPTLLAVANGVLLLAFTLHAGLGLGLAVANRRARPQRYQVQRSAGGRSLASRSMPYTGVAILLFLAAHLRHFQAEAGLPLADQLRMVLQRPLTAFFYLLGVASLALHVSHGFWSLFQTLGIDHPKYGPLFRATGLALSLAIVAVFGLIPLLALLRPGFLL